MRCVVTYQTSCDSTLYHETLYTVSSFISYFWDFPLNMTANKSGLRCETPWRLQHFTLTFHLLNFTSAILLHCFGMGLTLSSCDSECSYKQLGTSCSLPSHRKGCTTLAGTRRKSPYRLPGHSACQPTVLFGCWLHSLQIFTKKDALKRKKLVIYSFVVLAAPQCLQRKLYIPNRPVSLFLRLHRALTARLATHSNVESPIRRLKIPNSTSRDPAPAVQVSLMQSSGTPVFRFTYISE